MAAIDFPAQDTFVQEMPFARPSCARPDRSQPASASAPLALVRVFVWETTVHAPALTRYFAQAGHPFVSRDPETLPAPVRDRCLRGRVFEMFTLPMDLGAMIESLQLDGAERELEIVIDLSDLPLILVIRKSRPADPLHPEEEYRAVLDLLPTWQPDVTDFPAEPESISAPVASSPLRRPSRKTSTLKAPFSSVNFDDDDPILLFERSAATVR